MGAAASKEGRELLDAARRGDAAAVCDALAGAGPEARPKLLRSRTLLAGRGILHIAAAEGRAEGAAAAAVG